MEDLCNYYERVWLHGNYNLEIWKVYNAEDVRTTNNIEGAAHVDEVMHRDDIIQVQGDEMNNADAAIVDEVMHPEDFIQVEGDGVNNA